MSISAPLLGELLVARSVITRDQLHIALLEQRRIPEPLGKILVTHGFVSDAVLRDTLSETLRHESVDLSHAIANPAAIRLIPQETARRLQILPLAVDETGKKLILAAARPDNLPVFDQLRLQLAGRYELEIRLAAETEITRAIEQHYGFELSIDGILHEIETGETATDNTQPPATEHHQPVVRLIDALFADAVMQGASDIHFEPEQGFVRIRYRIDGVLIQIRALHRTYWPAMAVRLKVMAGLNIAETRAPQDGHITRSLCGRLLDFRVASQPTSWGENIVLRILDRQKGLLPLNALGLNAENQDLLQRMIARPEGILLVTGPTGSGKTTTLYSILNHINSTDINIMTLEDPVEYPLPLLRQTSVGDALKMDFSSGIRSMLRQDPDVILIGEIRDRDTAEMAFRAAMTGHQVYSTLHTHSALGAIPRLLDIGIPPDIMAGNIIGIVAQRLVRRLCPICRETHRAEEHERRLLGLPIEGEPALLFRPCGCHHCRQRGYLGRFALMEILHVDDELEELLACRGSPRELRQAALAKGFRPLRDEARLRVLAGDTSLEEVRRVVDLGCGGC